MNFNHNIYNEIQTQTVQDFLAQDEDNYNILLEMCSRAQFNKFYYELTDDEAEALDVEQFALIKNCDYESLLFDGLIFWWGSYENCRKYIRGFYDNSENNRVYFGSGLGYDTISSDLLGCAADGYARTEFIEFLNNYTDVNLEGGRAWMINNSNRDLMRSLGNS